MAYTDFIHEADRTFYDELTTWLGERLPIFRKTHSLDRTDVDSHMQMLRDWHTECFDGGWVGITWPREFGGRDATGSQKLLLELEFAQRRAPEALGKKGVDDVAPAIIVHGTPDQKARFLPPTLKGEWVWCQGFSEPDAGSDLASMRTRADRCDGGYRISGQKIWTTNGAFADYIWLLARTDQNAAKQLGISAFVVDMRSKGIHVRPIAQITGEPAGKQPFNHQFNEVFFDDVFVPTENIVGRENDGWQVAKTTLVQERAFRGQLGVATRTAEALAGFRDDPMIRELYSDDVTWLDDRIIDAKIMLAGLEQLFERSVQQVLSGVPLGSESSIIRLVSAQLRQSLSELAIEAAGPAGQIVSGPEAFKGGNAAFEFLASRSATIGSGTAEIQKNLIAERTLNLPRWGSNEENEDSGRD